MLGCVLLVFPMAATAQRHGEGGASGTGGGGISAITRPYGVDEKDNLKDFKDILALQATSQQTSQFQTLVRATETARSELQAFLQALAAKQGTGESAPPEHVGAAIEKVSTDTRAFQETFSNIQKNGLKEQVKRLAKADTSLEQGENAFDLSLRLKSPGADLIARAESLDKALADQYNQLVALGRAMSILSASGDDVAFTLPKVNKSVTLNGLTIVVPISTELRQTAVAADQRTFKLETILDLSDLQQNITPLLRDQLARDRNCRERIVIRQAWLTPATPASLLVLRLHYERWLCSGGTGQGATSELAESDGMVEIRLTPAVDPSGALKMSAAFGRIDAPAVLADALRNDSLGDDLREKLAQAVLSATVAASDLKTILPPALQNSVLLQKVKFQNLGAGALSLVSEGQAEISKGQADQLASQIKQLIPAPQVGVVGKAETHPSE